MATNNNNIVANKTRGKQKIEMKKIEKESDMITTFSKRKYGIYKKVNELITLTGSEVGFLVFSPAGKSFTFGQPSFKDLALRYLGRQKKQPQLSPDNGEMFRQARIQELNQTYNMLLELVEEEEKKDVALRQKLKGKQLNNWWNKTVEKVEVGELSDLESAYSELLMKVEKRRMELVSPRNDMNGCVSSSSSHFVVHTYHQTLNIGPKPSSLVQMVDQQTNMAPTMMTTTPNYPMIRELDGGIEAVLDHPSSSYGVPHSVDFGYSPDSL